MQHGYSFESTQHFSESMTALASLTQRTFTSVGLTEIMVSSIITSALLKSSCIYFNQSLI